MDRQLLEEFVLENRGLKEQLGIAMQIITALVDAETREFDLEWAMGLETVPVKIDGGHVYIG